jgi:hypothetical protein
VGLIPYSRASSSAAAHKDSGIGTRRACELRPRLRRTRFLLIPQTSGKPSACPGDLHEPRWPSPALLPPAGQSTDVSNFRQLKSPTLAEGTPCNRWLRRWPSLKMATIHGAPGR